MSYRITGIDTPFGGISWEKGKTNKEYAKSMVDFLSGQRILFNSCDLGCDHCDKYSAQSVLKMKDGINDQLTNIHDENDYKSCLRQMRNICNDFLNESICRKLIIHMSQTKHKALCPILKFRKDITYNLKIIVDIFNIDIDDDLYKVFCSNER